MLLTSGDFQKGHFNTMTIGWGSLGRVWGRPFIQVFVRPPHYTFDFMEAYDTFTLCAFPDTKRYYDALQLLGSKSGRDCDKIAEAIITLIASIHIAAPGFAEAELIFECCKIYWDDLDNGNFLMPYIEEDYPNKDYSRIYFGEILAVYGEDKYRSGFNKDL